MIEENTQKKRHMASVFIDFKKLISWLSINLHLFMEKYTYPITFELLNLFFIPGLMFPSVEWTIYIMTISLQLHDALLLFWNRLEVKIY